MTYDCSEVSARFCPLCGECCCREEHDYNDEDCPLHSPYSFHGDAELAETLWGTFEIGELA